MKNLVVIGGGLVSFRLVSEIVSKNPHIWNITIVTREPYLTYDRIQLSKLLSNEATVDDLLLKPQSWYDDNNITVKTGCVAEEVNSAIHEVRLSNGEALEYDELVMATGSQAFVLPIPGAELPGVFAFRNVDDCNKISSAAKSRQHAIVIGGGLLGLEVAKGLADRGNKVTVVHLMDHLMERQLDSDAGYLLRRDLESMGIEVLTERKTVAILGSDEVEGIAFEDGTVLSGDVVVMALGIRPEVRLAQSAGILVNRGIVVDDYMQTSLPHVAAVGECAEHRGIVYGIVAPLYMQARSLASYLVGEPDAGFSGYVEATTLKVAGLSVYSVGDFSYAPERDIYMVRDVKQGKYKKVVFDEGEMVGAVLYGDDGWATHLSRMVVKRTSMEDFLVWINPLTDQKEEDVLSWPDDTIVCGCNGVTKQQIADAITTKGLTTPQEVTRHTQASRSCGGCRGTVRDLLEGIHGGNSGAMAVEPLCSCTHLAHDEVKEMIRREHVVSTTDVVSGLHWNHSGGCPTCRAAVNYYIRMLWPLEHAEQPQDRLVNERLHANIQKDGTFSVVPRIYGGVIEPDALLTIAQVAKKYEVPLVKVTGGQRLDLVGIKKDDLPKVWSDLGMTSGHAYAKGFRTVKTCVGNDYCRFGTQDAIATGIQLEKHFEGLDTPHKVKMAVSGCPRNCAESTIKDVGVIGVDGGFDVLVGGNGGMEVRACDPLVRVGTVDEVIEWSSAFLQYYREEARYRERTSHWVKRVGIAAIKETLSDETVRQALCARLGEAKEPIEEPWQAVVQSPERQQLYQIVEVREGKS